MGNTVENEIGGASVGRAGNQKCRDASETEGKSRNAAAAVAGSRLLSIFVLSSRVYIARAARALKRDGGKRVC